MINKSKILLDKFSGVLRIKNVFRVRHWPTQVLDTLEAKYHLRPEDMLRLWYIRRRVSNGKYHGESLFIYDWMKAREKKISVRNSRDLYSNSDLLLFEGNMSRDGSLFLKRVRAYENN